MEPDAARHLLDLNSLKGATVVSDRPPTQGVDPGFVRRIETLRCAAQRDLDGAGDHQVALTSPGAGPVLRAWRALKPGMRIHGSEAQDLWISALNGPHMLLLARRKSRDSTVTVDVCDSLLMTLKASFRSFNFRSLIKALFGIACLYALPRSVAATYISSRDMQADSCILRGRMVAVVPQSVPPGLSDLPRYEGPPERIVIPADLSSKHNSLVLSWLIEAIEEGEYTPSLTLDVYGPVAPPPDATGFFNYKGWAPDIKEVYRGQTLVFAPNLRGAGVQNKLIEALAAQRPILIGKEAAGEHEVEDLVHTFTTREEMIRQLRALETYTRDCHRNS